MNRHDVNTRCVLAIAAGLAAAAFAAGPADAALLVYEGFNGYGSGTLSGKAPNANTVGLKTGVNFNGSNPGGIAISSTGLSLSNLSVAGGAGAISTGTVVATAQIDRATPYQGTLWASYLVNLTSRGAASANGMEVRLGSDDSTGNNRFRVQADSRLGTSDRLSSSYDADPTDASTSLSTGVTYIIISRFTNVGVTLSATTQGEATSWALTAAQFDALKADPNPEAYLLNATAGTEVTALANDAAVTSGSYGFVDGNRVQYVSVNDVATLDEVRYGSTLLDVTPVPEPATAGLLGVAVASVALRRRRGR